MRELTPDFTMSLPKNSIWVFGSNEEGAHGAGAALHARKYFGAIYGQARGLQGQSYAVITKKNWRVKKSSSLEEIKEEISKLYYFARDNEDKKFYVTRIGMGLAGWTVQDIAGIFKSFPHTPENIILPKEFEFRE